MDDLVRWLGMQLDEDERIAREALSFVDARWRVDVVRNMALCRLPPSSGGREVAVTATRWRYPRVGTPGLVPHVAEHDPARVLREIDTKRRTIELCAPSLVEVTGPGDAERSFVPGEGPPWGLDVLKLLALPYADRPGWREEWRP